MTDLVHATVETTTRYAHVLDADLAQAMDGFRVVPVRPKGTRDDDQCRA